RARNATAGTARMTPEGRPRMRYRTMGRLGWEVSEIGYGMWGIGGGPGGFTGWGYDTAPQCPGPARRVGLNLFRTPWAHAPALQRAAQGRRAEPPPRRGPMGGDEAPAEARGRPADAAHHR